MAALFQAIGTQSAGTNSVSVAWPTHVAGDLGLLVVETSGHQQLPATPSGWTAVGGTPFSDVATTAGSTLHVYWRFAQSDAEANVATGDSGDHQVARIVTFRGVDTTTPFDVTPVTDVATTASVTVTWPTITTATDGALIVLIATRPNDSTSTSSFSAPTNANLTYLFELGEAGTNAGNGGGFVIVVGTKDTAGATGTTTETGPNTTSAEMVIALRAQPEILPPLLRFDRVNYVRNSAAVGAVVGTPGTAPRNWSVVTGAGISSEIVAKGIDDGKEYVDIRFFGTGTGSFDNGVYIETEAAAVSGDRWHGTAYVSSVAGTVPSQFQIVVRELTSGGSLSGASGISLSAIDPIPTRYGLGRNFNGSTTTRAALWLQCSITNGQSIDFTFRVAGPQLSWGSDFGETYAATYDLVLPRQFYAPTASQSAAGQQIAPSLLSEGNTLYAPTATPGAVSAAPALLTNTSTLYTPSVTASAPSQSIAPALLSDGDTLYAPTSAATYSVAPALLTNSSTLYTPSRTTTVSVQPALHTNASTLYAPSRTATVSRTPSLLSDGDTLYVPTSSVGAVSVAPALLTNTSTLYTPTVAAGSAPTQNVAPSLYTDASVLYAPARTTAYSLPPALLTNASTLYAPTAAPGVVSRTPSLLTSTSTLYAPTTSTAYSVQPSLYSNTPTFYAPVVAFDLRVQVSWVEIAPVEGVNIAPLLLSEGNTLYAPTTSTGPVSRTPALLTNTSALYAPTTALTYSLTPALLSDGSTLYAPSVYTFGSLAPARLDNTSVLYAPTRTTGPVSRAPSLLTNSSALYTPTTAYVVAPTLLTNSSAYYAPTARPTTAVAPALLANANSLYAPSRSTTVTVAVALSTNTSVLYTPTTAYVVPPALLSNSNVHYAPTVRPTTAVAPTLLTNTSTLYTPTRTATVSVAPALLTSSSTVYTPSPTTTVSRTPALLSEGNTLYTPVLANVTVIAPALLTNSSAVYVPTRTAGAVFRQPAQLANAGNLYVPVISAGPVSRTPTLYVDPDSVYVPTVTAGQNRSPSLLSNTSSLYPPTRSLSYSIQFFEYVDSGYCDPTYSSPSGFSSSIFFTPIFGGLYRANIDRFTNNSSIASPFIFFPGLSSVLRVQVGAVEKTVVVASDEASVTAPREAVGVKVPWYEKAVNVSPT